MSVFESLSPHDGNGGSVVPLDPSLDGFDRVVGRGIERNLRVGCLEVDDVEDLLEQWQKVRVGSHSGTNHDDLRLEALEVR